MNRSVNTTFTLMRRGARRDNGTRPILKIGVALCLAGCATGCNSTNATPAAVPPPPAQAPPVAGTKPKGGNTWTAVRVPAPPGIETGNYAGGRKN